METKIINKPQIEGDLIFNGNLIFEISCYVTGKIKAEGFIKAGGSIEAGTYIFSFQFDISAQYFSTKVLPFYRKYWADIPILKNWKKLILDKMTCWGDFQRAITKKDAIKICKWEGWHWILKAHLEMFFGLTDKIIPPKGD